MFIAKHEHRNAMFHFIITANVAGSGLSQPGLSGGDRTAIERLKRWAARAGCFSLKIWIEELCQ